MSAFVVSQQHIEAMLKAAMTYGRQGGFHWLAPEARADSDFERGQVWGPTSVATARRCRRELDSDTLNETGRMLLTENVRSVCHRYDEPMDSTDLPGPVGFSLAEATFSSFHVAMHTPLLEPVAVLKAIACYEYQSCEHPDWEGSESKAFCEALRHAAINALPGYDEADWDIG